jgi:hypothetical protein
MARLFLKHRCLAAPDLHEVLIKRGDLNTSDQSYMESRFNCVTACNMVHIPYGNTRWFDRYAARVLLEIHGAPALLAYLASAPSRVPGGPEGLLRAVLEGPEPPGGVGFRWLGVPARLCKTPESQERLCKVTLRVTKTPL